MRGGAAFRPRWPRPSRRLLEGGVMLHVERVTKEFKVGLFGSKRLTAVSDVSFDLAPGEIVSLIGESGSGKTTVGRMILRLTPASGGSITFDGVDVAQLEGGALRRYYASVQGVFQDPFSSYNPVFKADRVFDLVRGPFLPELDDDAFQERLHRALEAVGLEPADVLDKYPHQLSGGQLQRLLIARALLLDLKVLVADEIISMLDASTRIDVLNLLGDLKARGLGVLFVTHDLSLGHYISDRTIILRRGRIVELGATPRVFSNPAHPYTQMLLTAVPHLHEKWDSGGGTAAAAVVSEAADGPLVEVEPDHYVASDGPAMAGQVAAEEGVRS
jgi:peptide/nickel transport system ATP-binding protein